MKNCIKIIAIVFTTVIVFTIAACNKQTQSETQGTNPFVGTWIDSGSNSKILFTDNKWMLTLNPEKYKDSTDGTYTFNNDNATLKFVFQADEFKYSANISGNTLTLEIDGEKYNFIKQ